MTHRYTHITPETHTQHQKHTHAYDTWIHHSIHIHMTLTHARSHRCESSGCNSWSRRLSEALSHPFDVEDAASNNDSVENAMDEGSDDGRALARATGIGGGDCAYVSSRLNSGNENDGACERFAGAGMRGSDGRGHQGAATASAAASPGMQGGVPKGRRRSRIGVLADERGRGGETAGCGGYGGGDSGGGGGGDSGGGGGDDQRAMAERGKARHVDARLRRGSDGHSDDGGHTDHSNSSSSSSASRQKGGASHFEGGVWMAGALSRMASPTRVSKC